MIFCQYFEERFILTEIFFPNSCHEYVATAAKNKGYHLVFTLRSFAEFSKNKV